MPDLIFVYLAPLIIQGLLFCTLKWTEILQTVQTHLWNQSSPQKKKKTDSKGINELYIIPEFKEIWKTWETRKPN